MSSIDTSNIDITFPIAGKDNDSQGFRNNYVNIVSGLETAKTEITTLETIAIPTTAPATPQGAIGDLAGMTRADTAYVYFCFADWTSTGSPAIWHRIAITPPSSITVW